MPRLCSTVMAEIEPSGAAPPESPDPPIEDGDRLRVCSISGLAGALAIVVAFFLPWVTVKPDAAAAYRERILLRLADERRPAPPHADDWRRLAEHVGRDQHAAGIDVFWWARIASVDEEGERVPISAAGMNARATRAILVGAVWLGLMPILATLLFAYFLTHHCKRARTPALITAMLVGAAAVLTTASYGRISGAFGQELQGAVGLTVLLTGGAVLFLAGSFGVKARNWWKVFGGAILIAGILALGIQSYVQGPVDAELADEAPTPIEGAAPAPSDLEGTSRPDGS